LFFSFGCEVYFDLGLITGDRPCKKGGQVQGEGGEQRAAGEDRGTFEGRQELQLYTGSVWLLQTYDIQGQQTHQDILGGLFRFIVRAMFLLAEHALGKSFVAPKNTRAVDVRASLSQDRTYISLKI
jgi:hypothetical protein